MYMSISAYFCGYSQVLAPHEVSGQRLNGINTNMRKGLFLLYFIVYNKHDISTTNEEWEAPRL